MKRVPPWLVLLLLAPLLGEIVSGHQPPLELLNPLSVILLMLPYGLGALIAAKSFVGRSCVSALALLGFLGLAVLLRRRRLDRRQTLDLQLR